MDESKLPTPHNNLLHCALSHAQAARDLIQTHLPADLVSALDLNSLELQKDTFVDEELRESYSDLLYSVQLVGQDGQRALFAKYPWSAKIWRQQGLQGQA